MLKLDPERLARRQLTLDRERTVRFPHLCDHKAKRMTASPLALLRGAAPLFYEILESFPALAEGPPGEGWIVGDAHLENFGAYRGGALSVREAGSAHADERVTFDLNDFDEAVIAPWRFDVLRLATSLLLGAREAGADGTRALELTDGLLDAYAGAAFHRTPPPPPPALVTHLIEKVRQRTRKQLLDARTEIARGSRTFTRGDRFEDLPHKLRTKAERAFQKFAARLPRSRHTPPHAFEVIDAAFRIAGTGSLGCLRIALLVRGKGGVDGAWIFDMKAEGVPSVGPLGRAPKVSPAERVTLAIEACMRHPPKMIGTTRMKGESMLVRRLTPQEDKLDFASLPGDQLEPLTRHLGALLGAAHHRGATRPPRSPWSEKDRAKIVDRAVTLAGVHEAMYLAYCDLVRA